MTIGLETMPVGVAGNTYTHLRQAIDRNFAKIDASVADVYSIGTPGAFGFGVGVCPVDNLPANLTPLPGCATVGHDNYGNYVHALNGSVWVFIPVCYLRENDARNPTNAKYAPNDLDIRGTDVFSTKAAAVAAGYRLHRAFVDGGVDQVGVFVGKYKSSKVAQGTGWVAAPVRNGLPLSSAADHNPVAAISACSSNAHFEFLKAAKGLDSTNGEFDQAAPYFEISVFIADLVAKLAQAHGQAATSMATCAWFDPAGVTNFPKGCNNNALKDANDATVAYQSDGYSNCGKTGSGALIAKTTHNGQNCGIADVNGLMWEVLIGMTCIASSKTITGVAKTNPVRLAVVAHGKTTGTVAQIESLVGPTALNAKIYTITVVDADTISLDGVDGSALPDWVSGGALITGTIYLAKESTAMRNFTSDATTATGHWGSIGVAAMMAPIPCPFPAPPGGISTSLKIGNGTNRVFASDAVGDAGMPMSTGVSAAGSAQFGQDLYQMYFRDLVCAAGCGHWNISGFAGGSARSLYSNRTNSGSDVSCRAACYPD